jgi:hypothetical protein
MLDVEEEDEEVLNAEEAGRALDGFPSPSSPPSSPGPLSLS